MRRHQTILMLILTLATSLARAQQPTLTTIGPTSRAPASEKKEMGWVPHVQVGSNLSFTSNSNVVGQTNGDSQTYGLNFKGELSHFTELTEWRNNLTIQDATAKTADIPRFVKTTDDLKYETAFLYSLPSVPKLGPYVNASVETHLFNGEDVQANDTTYQIRPQGATTRTPFVARTRHLTDPFKPLTTRESTGFFYKAFEQEAINLEVRLGLGAMQINADGQYAVTGKDASGGINVDELRNIGQFGVEAGAVAKGKIDDHSGWEASANLLTPLSWTRDPGDDRGSIRLTNVEMKARLTSKVTSWASFSYDYKFVLQPQLVDQTQQQHMLVLNLNYNLL